MMKERKYEAPAIKVVAFTIEQGFGASKIGTSTQNGTEGFIYQDGSNTRSTNSNSGWSNGEYF